MAKIHLHHAFPDLLRMAGDLIGERTQDVKLHAMLAQQRDRLLHTFAGRISRRVHTHRIMTFRQKIIGNTDQNFSLLQKPAPVFVQMHGVGL